MADAGEKGFRGEDCASSSILDKAAKNGKLDSGRSGCGIQPHPPQQRQPTCPRCESLKIWKDGLRSTSLGPVQRWLCRQCGYRFSETCLHRDLNPYPEKPLQKSSSLRLNSTDDIVNHRQVCAALTRGAKNLAEVKGKTTAKSAGASTVDLKTTKGLITQFAYWLEKEGYKSSGYLNRIWRLARLGADLTDPEHVKEVIGKQPWKDSVKLYTVCAYDCFAKMLNITWSPPKYKSEDSLPWIPDEKDLLQLIAASKSRRMKTFLQTLLETYADPGEALNIKWMDVDFKNNVISINHPVKRHNPRRIQVSTRLLAMLDRLPKKDKRVFPVKYENIAKCFLLVRKRAAQDLQNPRLLDITFRTFRHWGGTKIAYETHGNVLKVQKALGHKNIQNTMKYVHTIHFKEDEFDVETASTVGEIKELVQAGFEKADEKQGIHVFRRPKRFRGGS